MLSQAQLGFFARNGFLHVPRWIEEDTCRKRVDHTWTRLSPGWRRDEPSTWGGSPGDSCHIADIEARRGLLKFQGGDLLQNPVIEGAFAPSASGGQLAHALLGHPLGKLRIRGLYCIAPLAASSCRGNVEPHIEAHPSQLIALCYLEDVVPGGGGLSVWPGSHREVYPTLGSKLEHISTPAYEAAFAHWARLAPVEVPGKQGDIVIIHHRLLHAPSVNRSRNMRYGFLCDYVREDHRRLCTEAPSALWEDWPAIAALPSALREAPPDYTLKPQHRRVSRNAWSALHYSFLRAHSVRVDPSTVRKADASVLDRRRRAGDVWLSLSDEPKTRDSVKLFPRGSDLISEGVTVRVNGHALESVCKYDIVAQLAATAGDHVVEIDGLRHPAWLRVLAFKLPLVESEFLLQLKLEPGAHRLSFRIEDRHLAAATPVALSNLHENSWMKRLWSLPTTLARRFRRLAKIEDSLR